MKNKFTLLLICCCFSLHGIAQEDTTAKISKLNPKFVFQLDVRNSFIRNNSNYKKMIYGFWAGLDYSKKHIYSFHWDFIPPTTLFNP